MYLIEAMKSGRPFKRKKWGIYAVEVVDRSNFSAKFKMENGALYPIYFFEILADDYELKEVEITGMTEDIFRKKYRAACAKLTGGDTLEDALVKELFSNV